MIFKVLNWLFKPLDMTWDGLLDECDLCALDGYPGQTGHSTTSCEADRILNPEIYQ